MNGFNLIIILFVNHIIVVRIMPVIAIVLHCAVLHKTLPNNCLRGGERDCSISIMSRIHSVVIYSVVIVGWLHHIMVN